MSLRQVILARTGQDLRRCESCASCRLDLGHDILDISLTSLIQLIMLDDEEVLTTRTVWSDEVLNNCRYACKRNLDLPQIILALRSEAQRRGLV